MLASIIARCADLAFVTLFARTDAQRTSRSKIESCIPCRSGLDSVTIGDSRSRPSRPERSRAADALFSRSEQNTTARSTCINDCSAGSREQRQRNPALSPIRDCAQILRQHERRRREAGFRYYGERLSFVSSEEILKCGCQCEFLQMLRLIGEDALSAITLHASAISRFDGGEKSGARFSRRAGARAPPHIPLRSDQRKGGA